MGKLKKTNSKLKALIVKVKKYFKKILKKIEPIFVFIKSKLSKVKISFFKKFSKNICKISKDFYYKTKKYIVKINRKLKKNIFKENKKRKDLNIDKNLGRKDDIEINIEEVKVAGFLYLTNYLKKIRDAKKKKDLIVRKSKVVDDLSKYAIARYLVSILEILSQESKKEKKTKPKRKKRLKFLVLSFASASIILLFLGLLSLAGIFWFYAKDLDIDKINSLENAESTKIYDSSGEHLLYELYGEEKRTIIEYSEIPEHLVYAIVAVEDKTYYDHRGVNMKRSFRAVLSELGLVSDTGGGSTLTQQLIKNTLLTNERTYERKIKEIVLALQLEQERSKDEIMEMYLNRIPFGSNAYGAQAAALTFFGKNVQDLTLAESAILASLPNRPSYLSPYGSHRDELQERVEYTLTEMEKLGYIDSDQKEEAIQEGLAYNVEKTKKYNRLEININAPHFVFYVRDILEAKAKENPEIYGDNIETSGLKIITTLDWEMQKKAEDVVKEYSAKNFSWGINNMAMASMEPETGHIKAMVGSIDYWNEERLENEQINPQKMDGKVNVTIRTRQPGSSFKPYVYATAFSRGYTPKTIIYDVKTTFKGNYTPRNYSRSFSGPLPMESALAQSLNIPAVKAYYLAGKENVTKLAHDMGITTLDPEKSYGLSTALGAQEVRLIDHLAGLSTLANDGKKVPQTSILKIYDRDNKIIEDNQTPKEEKQVLDVNAARMVNSTLSNPALRTFGRSVHSLPGQNAAVKTGTTNKEINSRGDTRPADTWTIGYTPKIATVFWAGNNDNSTFANNATGTNNTSPAWQAFMKDAINRYPKQAFKQPSYKLDTKPLMNGKMPKGETVEVCKYEKKLVTEGTPNSQRESVQYGGGHTILYYIDKNNPNGPKPSNPKNDPEFNNWEKAVQSYSGKKISDEDSIIDLGTKPTEYCTVHDIEDKPQITINSPSTGTTINGNVTVNTSIVSPLSSSHSDIGIANVYYIINGVTVANRTGGGNQSVTLDLTSYTGEVTLAVRAVDSIDNENTNSVNITVQGGDVGFLNPTNGSDLLIGSNVNIQIRINSISSPSSVSFYLAGTYIGSGNLVSSNNNEYIYNLNSWSPTSGQAGNNKKLNVSVDLGFTVIEDSVNVNIN